jgi:hypothetical protein
VGDAALVRAGEHQPGDAASPTLDLCTDPNDNDSSTHDVTVTVTDGTNTATASVRVYVVAPRLG